MKTPYIISRPSDETALPLVCDSPHSGTDYPADFRFTVERASLRMSEDTHVDRLWDAVPRHGGTLLAALFPRSYVDTNRSPDDIDLRMIEPGQWPHPVQPSPRCLSLGIGVFQSETPQRLPIYSRKLTAAEVANRLATCWHPYHEALARELERAHARHGACWHLNLHSMPSNAYERLGIKPPHPLADIVLGDHYGTSCEPAFRDAVAEAFRDCGYTVTVNDPYEGADLTKRYCDPARSRHSLQVEINRKLYMHEPTREPNEGFESLRADIGRVVARVAEFVSARLKRQPAGVSA